MTRAIRNILHGPLPEKWGQLADATDLWRKLPYALLLASLLVFGCFPETADETNRAGRERRLCKWRIRLVEKPGAGRLV